MTRCRFSSPGIAAATLAAVLATGCATAGPPGAEDGSDSDGLDGPGTPDAGGGFIDASLAPDAAVIPGPADAAPQGTPDAAPQMGTPDAAPMGNDCVSGATCAGAMVLGTVRGDDGNDKLMAQGHQAAWFRVRVSETNSDIFGLSLRAGATLVSPAGADYDVIIYVNDGTDVIECNSAKGGKTVNGNSKTVRHEWGEFDIFSNGVDDDRDMSIEVRPVSGVCTAGAPWTLTIEGNWN